jgi:hypothetical protein
MRSQTGRCLAMDYSGSFRYFGAIAIMWELVPSTEAKD